jgi:hypothetical protein
MGRRGTPQQRKNRVDYSTWLRAVTASKDALRTTPKPRA